MPKDNSNSTFLKNKLALTHHLALRGKSVAQLRELAEKHLNVNAEAMAAKELAEELSAAARENTGLSKELGKSPISLKPSFYLTLVKLPSDTSEVAKRAKQKAAVLFDKVNAKLKETTTPSLQNFEVVGVAQPSENVIELQFTWHQIMRYWSTSAVFEHLYTLRVGFVFIDVATAKSLICCHSISERDLITEAIEQQLGISFKPISLTKELLQRIGSFNQVKRAGYFLPQPGPDETQEVTYGDEKLSAKPVVTALESNPKSSRKHSFYRIDLGGLTERGLGVTSDTAKLWIPAETPVETIRDYGLLLLKKFTATLKRMKEDGDIPGILKVLSLQGSNALNEVSGSQLRSEIAILAHELVQMLMADEPERSYTPPGIFLTDAIPQWFNPARLLLHDEGTGATAYWSDPEKQTQLLSFFIKDGEWQAKRFNTNLAVDLSELVHPVTESIVELPAPPQAVELWPTRQLHDILLTLIGQASSLLPKLKKVVALPFHIQAGRIVLNIAKSKSESFAKALGGEVDNSLVLQFAPALAQTVSVTKGNALAKELQALGEKCVHMTDDNCESCLIHRKFLCLRSLVARFLTQRQLLAHKGIELSDLQGSFQEGEEQRRSWFFSKLSSGKSGLTLRNANGAILLAQITAQLDKATFDTIGILSPSTINEDLRERIVFLAGLVGKKVVVINRPILQQMLSYFEEQTRFEKKDPMKVYKASRASKEKGVENEAVGSFV